jgi:hypothetical protein
VSTSDSVLRKNVPVEAVWDVARLLFDLAGKSRAGKRPLGESFIDGAFYLTFFESTFVPRVKEIRRQFWQTDKPPFPLDPANLHWPLAGPSGIAEYRSPSWSDEEYASFSAAIRSLGEDFAIPGYTEEIVLYGVPPAFPFLKYREEVEVFSEQASIELRAFSARTTGKQVSRFYKQQVSPERVHALRFPRGWAKGHLKLIWNVELASIPRLPSVVLRIDPPWPKPSALARFYDSQVRTNRGLLQRLYCGRVARFNAGPGRLLAKQGQIEQIRALAIFTLERKAGVRVRLAMKLFQEHFPTEMYSDYDAAAVATQYAEIRYQIERKLILGRMPFLKARPRSSANKR